MNKILLHSKDALAVIRPKSFACPTWTGVFIPQSAKVACGRSYGLRPVAGVSGSLPPSANLRSVYFRDFGLTPGLKAAMKLGLAYDESVKLKYTTSFIKLAHVKFLSLLLALQMPAYRNAIILCSCNQAFQPRLLIFGSIAHCPCQQL